MKTFIFIAGAPGSGKSTVASLLRANLDSPLFEFGWIPEFRNTGERRTTYIEDEALAFENLVLVARNYAAHNFKNVIITDLENPRIEQLEQEFEGYEYAIFTLRLSNAQVLKARVLDDRRSSGYRDWQAALQINEELLTRAAFKNERFLDAAKQNAADIADDILRAIRP